MRVDENKLVEKFREGLLRGLKGRVMEGVEMARNVIQFVVEKRFLNDPEIYDYKRQYQVLRDFFQLRCPVCNPLTPEAIDVWDKGREYLESEVLLEWSERYNEDVCPRCKMTRSEFERDGLLKRYNIMVGCAGMRSGKTTVAALCLLWFEHFLICRGVDLGLYFGLEKTPEFVLTVVATSGDVAKRTIWSAYKVFRERSEWFRNLKVKCVLEEGGRVVRYPDIRLVVDCKNSNSASLAGPTRVGFVIDELARFDTTESKRSAFEVWSVGMHSLKTVREVVERRSLPYWLGSLIGIGSPISEDDWLMKKLREAKYVPGMFYFHYATWEFNPFISRESLAQEFEEDYYGAMRDFGAQPLGAEVPLVKDFGLFVSKIVDKNLEPKVVFEDEIVEDEFGTSYVSKRVVDIAGDDGNVHYMAFDAGKSKDAFAGACAHGEFRRIVAPDGSERIEWVTVYDFVVAIVPRGRMVVWFKAIEDLIRLVVSRWKVGKVMFDNWSSDSIVQSLRKSGINVEQKPFGAMNVADIERFLSCVQEGKVRFFAPSEEDLKEDVRTMSDVGRFFWEAKRMRRSKDLKKIDHGVGSTSDLFEVVVRVNNMVQDVMKADTGYVEELKGKKKRILEREISSEMTGIVVKSRIW